MTAESVLSCTPCLLRYILFPAWFHGDRTFKLSSYSSAPLYIQASFLDILDYQNIYCMFNIHSRPLRRFGPTSEHIQLIFESFLGYTGTVSACLDSNLWPGNRKPGCSDSFCYHLAKRNTKNTNSDIIKLIAQLAVVTGRSEHQSGVSSVWPLIRDSSSPLRQLPRMHLSSCRSAVATVSCSLTDCSHCRRRFEIWNTGECFTCALHHEFRHTCTETHTHLFQSHVCVSQQSLTESLRCLYAPPFSVLTHRLA